MPLYEYKCLKCGRVTEKIERVSGPYLKKCPHCGGKVEALISASSIQFKGSGWYVTDYASKKSDSSASEKSSGEGSESKETKEAKESKESKGSKSESAKDSGAKETPTKEKKSEKKK